MQIEVLYEDEQVLVVSKPAGVVCNRAESVVGDTIQDWAERYIGILGDNDDSEGFVQKKEQVFRSRSGLAHRLDKDTSGALLLAKTPEALHELMRQFKERSVEKEYLALVHGMLEPAEGFVRLPIARSEHDRHQFSVQPFGKLAETDYLVDENYSQQGEAYSMVRLFPKTGRTHQIRVHMKHLGHPLVGDELYLGDRWLAQDRKWCPRHFLHAEKITFEHPTTRSRLSVLAPLHDDLETALQWVTVEEA